MMQPYHLNTLLGGAGPSEEELLGLALRYTSTSQIPNTHPLPPPPHPRPIWPSASLHQFYVHMSMGT